MLHRNLNEKIKRFQEDEKGLETVEYAVMTALIAGAMVVALGALAVSLTNKFQDTADIIN